MGYPDATKRKAYRINFLNLLAAHVGSHHHLRVLRNGSRHLDTRHGGSRKVEALSRLSRPSGEVNSMAAGRCHCRRISIDDDSRSGVRRENTLVDVTRTCLQAKKRKKKRAASDKLCPRDGLQLLGNGEARMQNCGNVCLSGMQKSRRQIDDARWTVVGSRRRGVCDKQGWLHRASRAVVINLCCGSAVVVGRDG